MTSMERHTFSISKRIFKQGRSLIFFPKYLLVMVIDFKICYDLQVLPFFFVSDTVTVSMDSCSAETVSEAGGDSRSASGSKAGLRSISGSSCGSLAKGEAS